MASSGCLFWGPFLGPVFWAHVWSPFVGPVFGIHFAYILAHVGLVLAHLGLKQNESEDKREGGFGRGVGSRGGEKKEEQGPKKG